MRGANAVTLGLLVSPVKGAHRSPDVVSMDDPQSEAVPNGRAPRWAAKAIRAQGASSPVRSLAIVALLLGLSWLLSYALGGAGRVPPHWFYVPVLVAAARFGLVGAAATGVVAGLLAGPLLPFDVAAGTAQHLLDWSGRLGFFLGVGLVMGAIIVRLKSSLEREISLVQEERNLALRKSSFIATVSHELRTPLTVIEGVSKTLDQRGWVADPGRPLLDSLHRANRRLDELIAAMLAAAEGQPLNIEPVMLKWVCAEVARGLERFEGPTRVRFAWDAGPPVVASDPDIVKQVLRHVIENALKFSPIGSPVSMSVERTGDGVEVQVRDQGPGISPAFLGRAFEPFTQAHSSTTREHGGLGIGLFVARQLLHRLSGRIDLVPHERGGTVAVLHIPNLLQVSKQAVTPSAS
jgi:signal transduction histidine kinase